MAQNPMICPMCGIPMNHHAEKLVEPRDEDEARRSITAFGGVIEEIHTCPRCGRVGSRAESMT